MWSIPWLSAGTRLSFFSFEPRRSVADIRCLNWELDSEFCPTKNAFSSIFIRDDATIEFEEYTDDVDDTYEDDSDEYNDEYSSSEEEEDEEEEGEEEEEEEDHTQDIEQELRKVLESSLGANSMIRRNYKSGYTDRTNGEAKYISFFPFSFTHSHIHTSAWFIVFIFCKSYNENVWFSIQFFSKCLVHTPTHSDGHCF